MGRTKKKRKMPKSVSKMKGKIEHWKDIGKVRVLRTNRGKVLRWKKVK